MRAAASPRGRREAESERMLVLDPAHASFEDARIADLPSRLRAGDLLVVNDAATLPASLRGRTRDGSPVEARLLARHDDGTWDALLFGAGSFRVRTEDRPTPPPIARGDELRFGADLRATVDAIAPASARIVTLRFAMDAASFWSALYREGRAIQYAYVDRPLALWDVQTRYAARPWASEMPSAGRPLTWGLLLELRRRGIGVASVTHAAGISSTGDPALDRLLPMREAYDVPRETARAIESTHQRGGRVIAVGTSVVRALESAAVANGGAVAPGSGETTLRIDADFRPRVVRGLLTGMHAEGESHFDLLAAFAPRSLLERANAHAERVGYECHEFGDSQLVLPC